MASDNWRSRQSGFDLVAKKEMSERRPPPNRRPGKTLKIRAGDDANDTLVHLTVNYYPDTGAPCEMFMAGPKPGSMLSHVLDDVAVIISVALQYGVPVAALERSLARVPAHTLIPSELADPRRPAETRPASVVGAAMRVLMGDLPDE